MTTFCSEASDKAVGILPSAVELDLSALKLQVSSGNSGEVSLLHKKRQNVDYFLVFGTT